MYTELQLYPVLQHLNEGKGLRWFQEAPGASATGAGTGAGPHQACASIPQSWPKPANLLLEKSQLLQRVMEKRDGDWSLARQCLDAVSRLVGR